MAVVGPKSPSVAENDSSHGTYSWSNPGNVISSDNSYATIGLNSSGQTSRFLKATGFGFTTADIPANATIRGILVEVEHFSNNANRLVWDAVRLVKAGTPTGSNPNSSMSVRDTEGYQSFGGPTELWGTTWTPADIYDPGFGAAVAIRVATGGTAYTPSVDHIRISVYYDVNEAPTISSGPSVNYGTNRTAIGPNNSATVTFTAQDANVFDQGTNALTYQVRTSPGGGGSLIKEGTCTHNVSKQITITNSDISSRPQGESTYYLSIIDGENARSADKSFTLKRDSVIPSSLSFDGHIPNPVTGSTYRLQFDCTDATSTGVNEMSYQVRTASGGGGTLLNSGNFTQGNNRQTTTFTDSGLSHGNNTRYLRVFDGAGNVREISFTVVANFNQPPEITVDPIVSYGTGNNAVGPNNSASVQFTATDDSDTGTNKLTYEVRTAASGGGTLIESGTCTHNVSKTITLTDAELSSLSQGNTMLYLSILDSQSARSADKSFVIKRDSVAPGNSTNISYTPDPVQPDVSQYTVTFTPHDTTTTETNALDYQIRTASGGGGTLLASGVATSGMPSTSATITDPALVYGNNTRYIRVIDGALNARDTSFTVALDAYNETSAPAQVVRVILTGDEYLTLDEEKPTPLVLEVATGGRDSAERNEFVTQALVILAHTEAADYLDLNELDTTLLLLAKTLGDDALLSGIEEFGPELTLKLVASGTDQADFRDTETDQELLLPVVGGGVDAQAMDEESAPSVRIYAVSRGVDSLTLNEETAPAQTLLAVVTGTENQAHDEVSLTELVLQAVTGGSDAPMYLETFGELLLLSVTAADTEQLGYAHFEPLVIPVVTAADPDTQEMEETAVTLQILVVTAGSDAQGGVIDEFDAPELEIPVFTLGEDTYTIGPIISYRTYNFADRNPYDQSTMIVN